MSSKYGAAAILATQSVTAGTVVSPVEGWAAAVNQLFPDRPAAREKPCPKCAYLGLCEKGLVKGVAPGSYTRSVKNKAYALRAVELLLADPSLSQDSTSLWHSVLADADAQNGQMDVVLALWNNHLIKSD